MGSNKAVTQMLTQFKGDKHNKIPQEAYVVASVKGSST